MQDGETLYDQQPFDTGVIGAVNHHTAAQMALGFGCFFTHKVAHAGPVAFDFTRAGNLESLLSTGVGFHFRHGKNGMVKKMERKGNMPLRKDQTKTISLKAYFLGAPVFLGDRITIIRLPSIRGSCSAAPCSSSSFIKRRSRSSPRSLNMMARPRNCT